MSDETDRIDRLELRLTEHEAVIEDLNATVTAQWRALDALTVQLRALGEQVREASVGARGDLEPPPHY